MTNKIYIINKGINKPITFRGLKAQYIWWLGGSVVGDMILFVLLYLCGISSYLCVPIVLIIGAVMITGVYRMSKKYGEYGLMKSRAIKYVPKNMRSFSRKYFTQLTHAP